MADLLRALAVPSTVCFCLMAVGVALCASARTRRAALVTLAFATVSLTAFSSGKTATWLLSPLEYAYPRVPDQVEPVRAIVVLTAYVADDPNMSLSDRPNDSSLYRVVEGVLLWKRCPGCIVVVTGYAPATNVMAELMVAMGVPRPQVQLDSDAATTGASAANMRQLLGDAPFYLVTSAGHMPRSMASFAAAGLHPLAAPTDHKLPRDVAQAAWALSPFHLECSDLAVHERLGMWWYRLRGVI